MILHNDKLFKRIIGGALMLICIVGFFQLYSNY
jgi:hypothetical protein